MKITPAQLLLDHSHLQPIFQGLIYYYLILLALKLVSLHPLKHYIVPPEYTVICVVIPPPVDVRATQSSSSAPLEVSWSPPTYHGPFKITGYRVFYGSGQNISVSKIATSIGFGVNETYDRQTVFIRSESNQLYGELVAVSVGKLLLSHL